jgi:peptidoglycan glycosyltransferase
MFNSELPWDMNYSMSSAICNADIKDSDMMQLGIGQGTTTVTPLHINLITAAIANDGILMKPYILEKVETEDGKVVEEFEPAAYKNLITSDEASFLKNMMEKVVTEGTASRLKGLEYTAAGKTGSAEFKDSTSDSHAWFTGYAPAENPKMSIMVTSPDSSHPNSNTNYASLVTYRITQRVTEVYKWMYGID